MKIINSFKIIMLLSLFYLLSACSGGDENIPKPAQVPKKTVSDALSRYFQERFIELTCVGNNKTFHSIKGKGNELDTQPKRALLTFKAAVKIDKIDRRVVGNISASSFVDGRGGMFTSNARGHISFILKIADWHFAIQNENTEVYCKEDKSPKIQTKRKPFKFTRHNNRFSAAIRFPIERTISKQLCQVGQTQYCHYIGDYLRTKVPTRGFIGGIEEHVAAEIKHKLVNAEFAKRYYNRLCKLKVETACQELNHIEEDQENNGYEKKYYKQLCWLKVKNSCEELEKMKNNQQ